MSSPARPAVNVFVADEGLTWRLSEAAKAKETAQRQGLVRGADTAEDTDALSAQLQSLIDSRIWVKKRK